MELKRLEKKDYDELIGLLNTVFGRKNKREVSFELDLPGMCRRTDEAMRKHLGVFEDGKLVAALGIYPLPCRIDGEEFMFSTVGNVATHPDFEGRGYMGAMMDAAMEELARIGADASRLGGARQRYNRFGYESAGVAYNFTVNEHNARHAFGKIEGLDFQKVEKFDTGALSYIKALHERERIYAERSADDAYFGVYASAVAWQATPYIVTRNGERIGYVSISKDEVTVSELYTEKEDDFFDILIAYQRMIGRPVQVRVPAYEPSLAARLASFSAEMNVSTVCHFKIINFEKITNALMRLKASYSNMPFGEFILGIEGYGSLRLFSDGKRAGAMLTDGAPALTLDRLTATRFLFGHFPASMIADVPAHVAAWLPLPLFWNLQDRV